MYKYKFLCIYTFCMQIYDENIVVTIGFLCIVCFYTTPCIYFILYADTVFLLLLRFITLLCIRCFMMKLYFYVSFFFLHYCIFDIL
jgi:hypothetical protein